MHQQITLLTCEAWQHPLHKHLLRWAGHLNNAGTHGYLTRIEDETDLICTCRKKALLFHMRLCKVGYTFLESQDLVHLSTPSLLNSVNALRNG